MDVPPNRKPRNTGPHELRDFGPTGHRLGTADDCYDGSPWELHHDELRRQMGGKDIHGIVMALLATLFRTHARLGITVMTDVYCDLSDATSKSIRAPDVVVVPDLAAPKNDVYSGTPILAVEIRGTQSKRYLEEKVKLYLEHDWPCTWIVDTEHQGVEVIRPGSGTVAYTMSSAAVPLPEELDKHGLTALPVAAFFQEAETARYNDDWVAARAAAAATASAKRATDEATARATDEATAKSILAVLVARGFQIQSSTQERILASRDLTELNRWLALAATSPSAEAFIAALG